MPKHPDMLQTLTPPPTALGDNIQQIYNATFSDGSLNPAIDAFGIGALQFGHSELNNPEPTFTLNGDLALSVVLPPEGLSIAPRAIMPPPVPTLSGVTAGVFATPLPFDTNKPFVLQGTYVGPQGPADGLWAIGILARTGGAEDLTINTQVATTMQFNKKSPGSARLNVPLGATTHTPVDLFPNAYSALDPLYSTTITLTLYLHRQSDFGSATLTIEGYPTLSTSFSLKDFLPTSGPAITAVGTVIANQSAYGETVSVRVQNFGIWATV